MLSISGILDGGGCDPPFSDIVLFSQLTSSTAYTDAVFRVIPLVLKILAYLLNTTCLFTLFNIDLYASYAIFISTGEGSICDFLALLYRIVNCSRFNIVELNLGVVVVNVVNGENLRVVVLGVGGMYGGSKIGSP